MTYEIEEISNTDMFVCMMEDLYRLRNGDVYIKHGNMFMPYITAFPENTTQPIHKAYQLITKEEKVLKILKDYERSRL